ncbi:MAG: bifunctional glutamate N-acetyltransferase/amino-acid acetyltransferase ArgJ [Armatimonadota bacterium]
MPVPFSIEPFERARLIAGSVTAAQGFSAAAWRCGIKASGREDLALLVSDRPCSAAGVFTTNRVRAACVDITRERLSGGVCQALVCNSGNANCYTGEQGWQDALEICAIAARELGLPEELVCGASTGVIGQRLPMDLLRTGIPEAAGKLSETAGPDFARAIMTTDTVPKEIACELDLSGGTVRIGMAAKGSGMIQPDLATMFCFATTDAVIPAGQLQELLREAVEQSFNCVTVDGDSSTNDMVLVFANGASGVEPSPEDWPALRETLFWMCRQMAMAIAADGEGATKLVEIRVTGARTDGDAKLAARTIANSPLVKTALFGRDPNWGRILAAAGRSGAAVEQEKMSLSINGRQIVRSGEPQILSGEERQSLLEPARADIELDLGLGSGQARFWTCDLSYDYVRINAEYHT